MAGTTIGMVDKVFESVNVSVGIALYTKVKQNELRYKILYLTSLVYYILYWPTMLQFVEA